MLAWPLRLAAFALQAARMPAAKESTPPDPPTSSSSWMRCGAASRARLARANPARHLPRKPRPLPVRSARQPLLNAGCGQGLLLACRTSAESTPDRICTPRPTLAPFPSVDARYRDHDEWQPHRAVFLLAIGCCRVAPCLAWFLAKPGVQQRAGSGLLPLQATFSSGVVAGTGSKGARDWAEPHLCRSAGARVHIMVSLRNFTPA